MELLPRDIIGIVYRYVYDCNYDALRREYKRLWLNDNAHLRKDTDVYWSDGSAYFSNAYCFFANWRQLVVTSINQHQRPYASSRLSIRSFKSKRYYPLGSPFDDDLVGGPMYY